jgi:hypothetical protein
MSIYTSRLYAMCMVRCIISYRIMNTKKRVSRLSTLLVKAAFIIVPAVFAAVLVASAPVYAAVEPGSGAGGGTVDNECQGVATAFDFECSSDENPIVSALLLILNVMAAGVGIAVIGGIIYGSILYATSGGAPERSKQGTSIITNAVIALIVFFLMWAAVNFLLPGGLLNTIESETPPPPSCPPGQQCSV